MADRRSEFVTKFDFGGNACDIHGPFLAPDGRIYWANCIRAFSIPRPDGTRIRAVADPVIEGRSVVLEAIRSLGIACRAWAAYPSDHPNVTQAVGAAQARSSG